MTAPFLTGKENPAGNLPVSGGLVSRSHRASEHPPEPQHCTAPWPQTLQHQRPVLLLSLVTSPPIKSFSAQSSYNLIN